MSARNVLITGASGYLGGSILGKLKDVIDSSQYGTVYALTRKEEHAKALKQAGFEPLIFDTHEAAAVRANVVDRDISVVFWLIDAVNGEAQQMYLKALGEVKQKKGLDVHFLHGIGTNNTIIELGQELGVCTYIFVPCIVYGQGKGLGNPISIQTAAIVKAAKALRRVYRVDQGRPCWPVSHIDDTTTLYLSILRSILAGENPGHGKGGYYLAAAGFVVWDDLYASMAAALAKKGGIIDSGEVVLADEEVLTEMGQGMGIPSEQVRVQLGGKCMLTARNGAKLGWKPQYAPDHVLQVADEEVDLVLKHQR